MLCIQRMQITVFWYTLGPTLHILCGIAGIWLSRQHTLSDVEGMKRAIVAMKRRGPDAQAHIATPKAVFGHVRLSIIDTSERSNQPMSDPTGRYTLVFNGEVYNYKELSSQLINTYGVNFITGSDTEVLLHGLIHEGERFLPRINGFFAFGFYDLEEHRLMAARDRFGIKPFYYTSGTNDLYFASSLEAITELIGQREIDFQSLTTYLQLSYIPAPATILKGVNKLLPGEMFEKSATGLKTKVWYHIPTASIDEGKMTVDIPSAFREHLDRSVQRRLVSDVPLGTFLSGGLDSSVITLLINRHQPGTPAFSIGFPDQPFYDESKYAKIIARHTGAEHHLIPVHMHELDEWLNHVLNSLEEPFADSSAVLVNILSAYTRNEVKVALSGDGADELMGGYNKHRAILRSLREDWINKALRGSEVALRGLPEGRHHHIFDKLRKLKRYSRGLSLDFKERYWVWACFTTQATVEKLLIPSKLNLSRHSHIEDILSTINSEDFNSVLLADIKLVLANDMLHKVDSMSMNHGLEVRVPFLDHELVEFVTSLPAMVKINKQGGKRLLRQAFEKDFPTGFFDRGKRGFEAPMGHWLKTVLSPLLDKHLDAAVISQQGLFQYESLLALRRKATSNNPGDSPQTLWAVLVFQHWYSRFMNS